MSNNESKVIEICSWRDADRMLKRLARIEARLQQMRTKAGEQIAAIEERLGEASAGLLSEEENLRQGLERFFRTIDTGGSGSLRSRTLPSGRIGLRVSSCLEISRPAITLRRLAERGFGDCIRLRQEIDRQALRRLDEETLRSLGVKHTKREVFYVVAKKEG